MAAETPHEFDLIRRISNGEDKGGFLTEELLTSMAKRQGYEVLEGGKYGGGSNNGFDLVLRKPGGEVVIVVDGKQMNPDGSFKLSSHGAGGTTQGSDRWVDQVLLNLPDGSPAKEAVQKAKDTGKLRKSVAGVDRKTGKVINVPIVD